MDSITGRRRRHTDDKSLEEPTKKIFEISRPINEYVPDLYKSMGGKKFKAEQPENDDEMELIRNLPCDTEAALLHVRASFPPQLFHGRLPPIILHSQLSAIISNQSLIDTQLSKLAKENKILTFSTFTSSNYLIVFLDDFAKIEREGTFDRFVKQVIAASAENSDDSMNVQRSLENSKYFSKDSLRKRWKFEEDEIRKLVNAGYLGIQEGGLYCTSLPGAGEFIRCLARGKKAVLAAIKRSKFGEILQTELEKRQMKKSAPLGVLYHIYDLIGSGVVNKVETTSGPLLKVKKSVIGGT